MTKGNNAIQRLVVNLRCEWCKSLFPWKPQHLSGIASRIPRTCCVRCKGGLRRWEYDRSRIKVA